MEVEVEMARHNSRAEREVFELQGQGSGDDNEETKLCSLSDVNPPGSVLLRDEANQVDFVLVWDEKSQVAHHPKSIKKRLIFEENLRSEGLILDFEPRGHNGLHFVKIRAPLDVLKRYAEILKLRLPMKKFIHIKEIGIESLHVPILSDVVNEFQAWVGRLKEPFMFDEKKFQQRSNELTANFSRDKEYLFDTERHDFFTQSIRSRIIEFILKRKRLSEDDNDDFAFGIDKALNEGIYSAAYPLHDGNIKTNGTTRNILYKEWASFRKIMKFQPLDAVRDYFGVKIALYFAWLGFYTNLLIVPSIVGLLTFLYGIVSLNSDVPSQEICNSSNGSTLYMCPACDFFCEYWVLHETCLYSKITYLFDNESTVFFSIFMSFWAALFLEFWKQYSREITHRWDVTGFTPEEEHPRPEYLEKLKNVEEKSLNFITQTMEPKVPFWTRKVPGVVVSISMVLLMVALVTAAVFGVILYRISMVAALSVVDQEILKSNASLFISGTGASINLVCILIVNQIYGYVAEWLTELELNRTQTEFDDSMSLKIYLLQFVNYYSSIFYVAFFKGKFVGHPGEYNRLLKYRQEECSPGGCYMEVCLQMAIIFVGKQFFLSIVEYHLPRLWKLYNTIKVHTKHDDDQNLHQWVKDYKLVEWGKQTLFYEYLEMVIQYGFITIFVSAFPLAPLFALVNNIFELRVDAKKLLFHHRRPVALRVRDIGIWLQIMESLGRLSVFTNAFIIAFTSEFIPKLVYKYRFSPDFTLNGYMNFTLSIFDVRDFGIDNNSNLQPHVSSCRYYDFRHPPDHPNKYAIREEFWQILVARLAFVVVFQNIVALSVMAIRWIVPNTAGDIKERIRREAYLTNELIIRTELLKATGKLNLEEISTVPEEMGDRFRRNGGSISREFTLRENINDPELGDRTTLNPELETIRNRKYSIKGKTGDVTDGHIVI